MTISADPDPSFDGQPAARAAALHASIEADGATTVIHLAGSLRCATAPTVHAALDTALEQRPATIVVNLAEVRSDDELGLWVLPAIAGDVARRGINLVIAAPHRALRVRLRCLGGRQLEITDIVPAVGRSVSSPIERRAGHRQDAVPSSRESVSRIGGEPAT